jgi:hypothetical protein
MPSGAWEPLKRISKKKGEYICLWIITQEDSKRAFQIFPK